MTEKNRSLAKSAGMFSHYNDLMPPFKEQRWPWSWFCKGCLHLLRYILAY